MALLNPRFDVAGTYPGEAEHWTLITYVAAERIMGFGPEPHRAWEDFERWIDFKRTFEEGDLVLGFFDPLYEGYEDFNEAWDNSSYMFELPTGRVITYPFGGGVVDDMQEGWLTEPFAREWDDITAVVGVFDGDTYEDFEDEWKGNEAFAWEWGAVSSDTAMFDSGAQAAERFILVDWPPEEEE
ncbi:MAG: hypothetical protein GY854_25230 [Deltaproteobacteria bacterium]|nr:hypothetical protein [Deltaproteobacteria bacterium]